MSWVGLGAVEDAAEQVLKAEFEAAHPNMRSMVPLRVGLQRQTSAVIPRSCWFCFSIRSSSRALRG